MVCMWFLAERTNRRQYVSMSVLLIPNFYILWGQCVILRYSSNPSLFFLLVWLQAVHLAGVWCDDDIISQNPGATQG